MKRGHTIAKWTVLVLLTAYATAMTVWARHEAARHVCTGIEVEVTGESRMNDIVTRGLQEELRRYPGKIKGAALSTINTHSIEKYLGGLSNFDSVNCMISSGGILKVKVRPLVPVMRVFVGDNSYYINKDGKHITSSPEFFTDVPVVTGSFSREFPPTAVLPLIRHIEKDPFLKDLTSMVVARDSRNLIIVPRIFGHVVNMGDTSDMNEKSRALSLFYRKVMPYKGWQEYDTVSVKFRNQIVATRRDKTRLNHGEEYIEETDPEEATLPETSFEDARHEPARRADGEDSTANTKPNTPPED